MLDFLLNRAALLKHEDVPHVYSTITIKKDYINWTCHTANFALGYWGWAKKSWIGIPGPFQALFAIGLFRIELHNPTRMNFLYAMYEPHLQFPKSASLKDKNKETHLGPTVYEDTDISCRSGGDRTWQGASAQKAYSRFITQGESYSWEKRRSVWTIYLADVNILQHYLLLLFSHGVGKSSRRTYCELAVGVCFLAAIIYLHYRIR